MQTVIGYFEQPANALRAAQRLPLLAIDPSRVQVLTTPQAVRQHMECSQRGSVGRGAAAGGLLAAPVAAMIATMDALRAMEFGVAVDWALVTAVGFTLGGIACGAFMGALVGRDNIERDTHLYLEGVRRGGALIMAQVEDYLADTAMNILRQQGGLGVRICTRVRIQPARENTSALAGQEPAPVPRPAGPR